MRNILKCVCEMQEVFLNLSLKYFLQILSSGMRFLKDEVLTN